jgi:peptidoglycan/xylan/chitin deacetylase (PgdA/CDA1 family)
MSDRTQSAFYALKAGATHTRSALWHVFTPGPLHRDGLRILFYHRVSDEPDELAVRPRRFREQMAYLDSEGYRVVDVVTAAELLDSGTPVQKTIALTFDDGYLDNAEHALPVFSDYGFRATVFIAPAVTDGTATFSWYRRQPPLLDWDDLLELDRDGSLRVEAHSLTHPNLLALDGPAARTEIAGAKRALEARLGRSVHAFSYPSGLFGEREMRLVREAGYRFAVSCEPGVNNGQTDRFALRRRQIDARDTLLDFRAKVAGGHDSPPPLRSLYRRLRYGSRTDSPHLASMRALR